MIAGLMSLVLQLLLTGRVLRTAGVGVGALHRADRDVDGLDRACWLLGTLVAAAALKASDQVLRYSIDKATVELLYPAGARRRMTFRVKSFIDTVVYRLGDALGGLAVLLFAAVLGWSPVQMSAWSCSCSWRRGSGRRFVARRSTSRTCARASISIASTPSARRAGARARSAADMIASQLKGHAERDRLRAQPVRDGARPHVHPAVRGLLHHESPESAQQAIRLLARAGRHAR